MSRETTVRLVSRGEEHPYVIEVTTPGWRGCDYLDGKSISERIPADLKDIRDCLAEAGVKHYSPSEPTKDGVMIFNADGTTEFVLRDGADFQAAVSALVRAGWLRPEMSAN